MKRKGLWFQWTLACMTGELLGLAAAGVVAAVLGMFIGEPTELGPQVAVHLGMVAAGGLQGVMFGFLQGKVLESRWEGVSTERWTALTVIGAAGGWFVSMIPMVYVPENIERLGEMSGGVLVASGLTAAAIFGLCFGVAQWFELRRHFEHAGRWIPANALGWAMAAGVLFLLALVPIEWSATAAISGVVVIGGLIAAACIGLVSGAFLIRLPLRKRSPGEAS